MVFQCHQKAEKCLGGDLESLEKILILEYLECCAGENSLVGDDLAGLEHIQAPAVDILHNLKKKVTDSERIDKGVTFVRSTW